MVLASVPQDQFTPLYAFGGGSDGQYSVSSLSLDSSGALFGTAILGGTAALGVVFEIGQ